MEIGKNYLYEMARREAGKNVAQSAAPPSPFDYAAALQMQAAMPSAPTQFNYGALMPQIGAQQGGTPYQVPDRAVQQIPGAAGATSGTMSTSPYPPVQPRWKPGGTPLAPRPGAWPEPVFPEAMSKEGDAETKEGKPLDPCDGPNPPPDCKKKKRGIVTDPGMGTQPPSQDGGDKEPYQEPYLPGYPKVPDAPTQGTQQWPSNTVAPWPTGYLPPPIPNGMFGQNPFGPQWQPQWQQPPGANEGGALTQPDFNQGQDPSQGGGTYTEPSTAPVVPVGPNDAPLWSSFIQGYPQAPQSTTFGWEPQAGYAATDSTGTQKPVDSTGTPQPVQPRRWQPGGTRGTAPAPRPGMPPMPAVPPSVKPTEKPGQKPIKGEEQFEGKGGSPFQMFPGVKGGGAQGGQPGALAMMGSPIADNQYMQFNPGYTGMTDVGLERMPLGRQAVGRSSSLAMATDPRKGGWSFEIAVPGQKQTDTIQVNEWDPERGRFTITTPDRMKAQKIDATHPLFKQAQEQYDRLQAEYGESAYFPVADTAAPFRVTMPDAQGKSVSYGVYHDPADPENIQYKDKYGALVTLPVNELHRLEGLQNSSGETAYTSLSPDVRYKFEKAEREIHDKYKAKWTDSQQPGGTRMFTSGADGADATTAPTSRVPMPEAFVPTVEGLFNGWTAGRLAQAVTTTLVPSDVTGDPYEESMPRAIITATADIPQEIVSQLQLNLDTLRESIINRAKAIGASGPVTPSTYDTYLADLIEQEKQLRAAGLIAEADKKAQDIKEVLKGSPLVTSMTKPGGVPGVTTGTVITGGPGPTVATDIPTTAAGQLELAQMEMRGGTLGMNGSPAKTGVFTPWPEFFQQNAIAGASNLVPTLPKKMRTTAAAAEAMEDLSNIVSGDPTADSSIAGIAEDYSRQVGIPLSQAYESVPFTFQWKDQSHNTTGRMKTATMTLKEYLDGIKKAYEDVNKEIQDIVTKTGQGYSTSDGASVNTVLPQSQGLASALDNLRNYLGMAQGMITSDVTGDGSVREEDGDYVINPDKKKENSYFNDWFRIVPQAETVATTQFGGGANLQWKEPDRAQAVAPANPNPPKDKPKEVKNPWLPVVHGVSASAAHNASSASKVLSDTSKDSGVPPDALLQAALESTARAETSARSAFAAEGLTAPDIATGDKIYRDAEAELNKAMATNPALRKEVSRLFFNAASSMGAFQSTASDTGFADLAEKVFSGAITPEAATEAVIADSATWSATALAQNIKNKNRGDLPSEYANKIRPWVKNFFSAMLHAKRGETVFNGPGGMKRAFFAQQSNAHSSDPAVVSVLAIPPIGYGSGVAAAKKLGSDPSTGAADFYGIATASKLVMNEKFPDLAEVMVAATPTSLKSTFDGLIGKSNMDLIKRRTTNAPARDQNLEVSQTSKDAAWEGHFMEYIIMRSVWPSTTHAGATYPHPIP